MEVAQVALAPLVVLLDELVCLFAVDVAVLDYAFDAFFDGCDDFNVADITVAGEHDLAGPADYDDLTGLAVVLYQRGDEQLARARRRIRARTRARRPPPTAGRCPVPLRVLGAS